MVSFVDSFTYFLFVAVFLQARLQELKAAGHVADLEYLEESLIAIQGKSAQSNSIHAQIIARASIYVHF